MKGIRSCEGYAGERVVFRLRVSEPEPLSFQNMTVEENILIGFKEKASVLHETLLAKLEETGFELDLTRKASTLSIAEQELVDKRLQYN